MKFPHLLSIILFTTVTISSCSILNAVGVQSHMAAVPPATCSHAQIAASCSGGTGGACHALVNALRSSTQADPFTFIFLLALVVLAFFVPRLSPRIKSLFYRLTEINISPPQMLLADGLVALRI